MDTRGNVEHRQSLIWYLVDALCLSVLVVVTPAKQGSFL